MQPTYKDIFSKKLKTCKTKKDYKKLCKEMIYQFDVIDHIDQNQWRLFSELVGEDIYAKIIALSIKMYFFRTAGNFL